jgi:phage terminase large subunit
MTVIEIPYAPRRYQVAFHDAPERFQVIVAHRRAGKTLGLVNHIIRAALLARHAQPQFAYVAPTYRMAKRIAWDYVKRYSGAIQGSKANASELSVRLPNNAKVMLLGADSIHDLRGIYLHGAVLDEYAMMSPRVFPEVILPALMDYGGWAILAGTPLGANQLKRAYMSAASGTDPNWRAHMLRASETGAIGAADLAIARQNMSTQEYAQEFECSFDAVIKGAYYGEMIAQAERDGRLTRVDYDPALPVIVAVDLGIRDAFACGFIQEHPSANQVRMFDYREFHGMGLQAVKQEIDRMGYPVAHWIGPHDLAVRELGTGRSRLEVARGMGMNFAVAANLPLEDGREAVRQVLPTLWVDAGRCETFIDAMRQHRALYDDELEIEGKAAVHDWTSHGADMFRYYCVTRPRYNLSNWGESGQAPATQGSGAVMRRLRRG